MRKLERNRLYMIQAVNKVAKENQEAWQEYPEFGDLFGKLNAYEEQMVELIQRKQSLLQPFSGIKQNLRNDFALIMGKLAAYLMRIGREQNDQALIVAASFTVGQFERLNGQKALVTAETILGFAEQYQPQLEENSYAAEVLAKVKEQFAVFQDKGLIPSERRTKLGETTIGIKRLWQDITDFLNNELDLMMRVFIDEEPEFHLSYENARVVPKLAGARGPSGSDEDEGNEDPLGGLGDAGSDDGSSVDQAA